MPILIMLRSNYQKKNASKTIPVRSGRSFLIQSNDYVLLEKRPGIGIWSNLFSLPESVPFFIEQEKSNQPGLKRNNGKWNYSHQFSHYKLNMQVDHLILDKKPAPMVSEGRYIWTNSPLEVGLPSPIKKLMERIFPATG